MTFAELLTQKQGLQRGGVMAERCGISRSMWSLYVNGKRLPERMDTWVDIAAGIGVTPQRLFAAALESRNPRNGKGG